MVPISYDEFEVISNVTFLKAILQRDNFQYCRLSQSSPKIFKPRNLRFQISALEKLSLI